MNNVKEVLVFLAHTANASVASMEDGKLTISDFPKFKDAALSLIPAIKDADKIKDEWNTRTDEQMEECVQAVADVFDVANQEVEDWVENAVDLVLGLADLIDDAGEVFAKSEVE